MISFIKFIINIVICHLLYRVRYIHKEKEEKLDKCIICPNHSNTLEPTWIYARTKNIFIMAKAELFKNKVVGYFFRKCNIFPIHRGEKDIRSLLHAINLFKNVPQRKLLIFPEGERIKKERERGNAKVGPAYVAYKAQVPIVPVYITKNAKLFSKVEIIYGDPIDVTKEVAEDKEKLRQFSDELLDKIYALNTSNKKNTNS